MSRITTCNGASTGPVAGVTESCGDSVAAAETQAKRSVTRASVRIMGCSCAGRSLPASHAERRACRRGHAAQRPADEERDKGGGRGDEAEYQEVVPFSQGL